ncbi:MAG: hypothetical protein PGN13_08020 [Patulibacter minatonensis]
MSPSTFWNAFVVGSATQPVPDGTAELVVGEVSLVVAVFVVLTPVPEALVLVAALTVGTGVGVATAFGVGVAAGLKRLLSSPADAVDGITRAPRARAVTDAPAMEPDLRSGIAGTPWDG